MPYHSNGASGSLSARGASTDADGSFGTCMKSALTRLALANLVLASFLVFESRDGSTFQRVDTIDGTVIQAAERTGVQVEQRATPRTIAMSDVLTVTELENAKGAYAGKHVRVRGTTVITARISTIHCPTVGPCDRVIGVDLLLAPEGSTRPHRF